MKEIKNNVDKKVVDDFGKEWSFYDQRSISDKEISELFDQYFDIFPLDKLNKDKVGFDFGCGSGRWAKFILPKVKKLVCIDASNEALKVAKENLKYFDNCEFECSTPTEMKIKDNSMDFGYSLGVLHHVPFPEAGLKSCVSKLKKGSPFLIYLYYKFDNRPKWYVFIWNIINLLRKITSKFPFLIKLVISFLIALFIYFPLARISLFLEKLKLDVSNIPLSWYRNYSFTVMTNDSLDRFGTRIEKRYYKKEIREIMTKAGLVNINFSKNAPYWCAIGYKK